MKEDPLLTCRHVVHGEKGLGAIFSEIVSYEFSPGGNYRAGAMPGDRFSGGLSLGYERHSRHL